MKFAVKTEKQLTEERLLPAGEYPFQISNATDKISKSGNEMIEVLVRVFKPDGNFILVTDYLMEAMQFKLLHAAEACGLSKQYESGQIVASDFVGKTGNVKLKIQDAKDPWPAKNVIGDYVVLKEGEEAKPIPENKNSIIPDDSDIPF